MYKKKISSKQFLLDCINKEFEIIGSTKHWDTYEELIEWSKLEENKHWYSNDSFATPEQWKQWKQYYMEHFYDWQPQRVSERVAEREFFWFNLSYGLKYDFDYNLLHDD